MNTKKYSLPELRQMLIDFHNNHPKLGNEDEWYGDQAYMTSNSAYEFLHWIKSGKYGGCIEDVFTMDGESILGIEEPN